MNETMESYGDTKRVKSISELRVKQELQNTLAIQEFPRALELGVRSPNIQSSGTTLAVRSKPFPEKAQSFF